MFLGIQYFVFDPFPLCSFKSTKNEKFFLGLEVSRKITSLIIIE